MEFIILPRARTLFVTWFFILVFCAVFSQKKHLQPEEYQQWSKFLYSQISGDGEWIAHSIKYGNSEDTLFLHNKKTERIFKFPKGIKWEFSKDSKYFFYVDPEKGVGIFHLNSTKEEHVNGTTYTSSPDGKYLAIPLVQKDVGTKELLVMDLEKEKNFKITAVREFSFSSNGKSLAFITKNSEATVHLLHLEKPAFKQVLKKYSGSNYLNLNWSPDGGSLMFLEEFLDEDLKIKNHHIHFVKLSNPNQFYVLNPLEIAELKGKSIVSDLSASSLFFSMDAQRIFFKVKELKKNTEDDVGSCDSKIPPVQVWNSKDDFTYPQKENLEGLEEKPNLWVWTPSKNSFLEIESKSQPNGILNADYSVALTFDPRDYKPRFRYKEDYIDVSLIDLKSGNTKLILKKQLYSFFSILPSPTGEYVAYFRDKDWWIYNVKTSSHTNITGGLSGPFYDLNFDRSGTPPPYGFGGWTLDGKNVLVYDQYDIWKINFKSKVKTKLTSGREEQISFRLEAKYDKGKSVDRFFGFESAVLDLDKGLVLQAFGEKTKESGYYAWNREDGNVKLVYGNSRKISLKKARNTENFIFLEEKYDLPPQLVFYSGAEKSKKVIYRSNNQHDDFHWGKAELIDFMNSRGDALQGILNYPANYMPGKKYPMIVEIYEKKADQLYRYVNPSTKTPNGFNPTNFNLEGYFVFRPDIKFELNDPAISALDCVISGLEKVLEKGIVDEENIALMGHSYGGYLTSFIISKTDRFKTAVIGAPVTDMVSSYLSMVYNDRFSSIWRFEAQQFRFKGSYFDNKEAYHRNSPIHQVEGIEAPVLLWSGNKDGQVDWSQSLELYIALRRLEKKAVFLVYPDEGHSISSTQYEDDLYKRVKEWLQFHLKGEPAKLWIQENSWMKEKRCL